jgi:hypothetical protein
MDSQPVTDTVPASDIHPDVLNLAQQISDKANELVAGVESLDANNWLSLADDIDTLNSQLQGLLVEAPAKSSAKSTKSQTTSDKDSEKVN